MQTTTRTSGKKTPGFRSYEQLIAQFMPRPITSNHQLEEVQLIVDSLLDQPVLSDGEQEYLSLLGVLIHDYELTLEPIFDDIYGIELLKVLMEERQLKQKDLVPIFKNEPIVSDVMKGKRELTKRHIEELAAFFSVSPAVFFQKG